MDGIKSSVGSWSSDQYLDGSSPCCGISQDVEYRSPSKIETSMPMLISQGERERKKKKKK